jgi:DNA polymerase-1
MDVQAAANVLNENLYVMASLDTLQTDWTSIKKDYNTEFGKMFDKSDMLSAKKSNLEKFNEYACYDADVTRRVGIELKKELLKENNKNQANYFVKFIMPTIRKTLFEISKNGIAFDSKLFPKTRSEIKAMLDRMETRTLKLIPEKVLEKHKEELKLSRSDILRDALFSNIGYGLPVVKKNKTGPSIDEASRQKLLDTRGISSQAKKCLENYGEYKETHTLYTRNLKNFDSHVKSDERIHSKFSIVKAVTGRMSSSEPNLMAIPKRSKLAPKIRKLLCAAPGYVLVPADESQAELRWIAHVANDPTMIKIFNSGKDIHTETAKVLIGPSWDNLSKGEQKKARQNAKVVNFGLIYGMRIKGFIDYAKAEYEITLSYSQAEKWINIFFNTYNRLPIYHQNTIAFCRKYGFVESCLGRRRHLPEISSSDLYLRGYAERQAINHKIQSPSSDTTLIAGNDFIDQKYPYKEARIVLFIHDELIFEIKEDLVDNYIPIIKYHMENPSIEKTFGIKLKVPLKAGLKIGPNLKDLEELE